MKYDALNRPDARPAEHREAALSRLNVLYAGAMAGRKPARRLALDILRTTIQMLHLDQVGSADLPGSAPAPDSTPPADSASPIEPLDGLRLVG